MYIFIYICICVHIYVYIYICRYTHCYILSHNMIWHDIIRCYLIMYSTISYVHVFGRRAGMGLYSIIYPCIWLCTHYIPCIFHQGYIPIIYPLYSIIYPCIPLWSSRRHGPALLQLRAGLGRPPRTGHACNNYCLLSLLLLLLSLVVFLFFFWLQLYIMTYLCAQGGTISPGSAQGLELHLSLYDNKVPKGADDRTMPFVGQPVSWSK